MSGADDKSGERAADGDEGFLQRWSRRKRTDTEPVRKSDNAETESDPGPQIVAGRMITEPELLAPNSPAETIDPTAVEQTALDPARIEDPSAKDSDPTGGDVSTAEDFENFDFETLTYESDFQRFMQAGVPEFVRRKALRKLWLSNPVLANIDGLNDYDEDFTDAKLAVENLQTAFKAKHGYMTEDEVAAQERLGREEEYDAEQERLALAEADAETTGQDDASLEDDPEAAQNETQERSSAKTASSDETTSHEADAVHPADHDDDDLDDDGDTDWA